VPGADSLTIWNSLPQVSQPDQINLAIKVAELADDNDTNAILTTLQKLEGGVFPQRWVELTQYALMMDDWSVLSDPFAKQEFLGPKGYFFVLAPYQDASGGIRLSAIVGKHEALDPQLVPNIEQAIQNEFGILNEAITQFIPFSCLAAGGHFSSPMSEAFILPELWMIPNSVAGPSLSNTTQHRRRLNGKIGRYLPQIFEPQTSELLIDALADETIGSQRQTIEYLYHEAGHASGLGIKRKVRENLFHDVWDGGVEEWRTDGIEFEPLDFSKNNQSWDNTKVEVASTAHEPALFQPYSASTRGTPRAR
jgi:hypothetical protein